MPNSNLITHGLGGTLITHGLGGVTVEVVQPVSRGGGGGASLVIPEAIVVARAKVQIKHVNPVIGRFRVITNNFLIKSSIPVQIRKIAVSFKTLVAGLTVESFVKGLSLSIRSEGIDVDEGQSQ